MSDDLRQLSARGGWITISISTGIRCARNAASSAFSAIPTRRQSPPSGCMRSQHRGQEAVGMVSLRRQALPMPSASSGWWVIPFLDRAMIGWLGGVASASRPYALIPTTGRAVIRLMCSPLFRRARWRWLRRWAHNGNLTNGITLRDRPADQGRGDLPVRPIDTPRVILTFCSRALFSPSQNILRLIERVPGFRPGAGRALYAAVGAVEQESLIGARGIRLWHSGPLVAWVELF